MITSSSSLGYWLLASLPQSTSARVSAWAVMMRIFQTRTDSLLGSRSMCFQCSMYVLSSLSSFRPHVLFSLNPGERV